MKHPHGMHPVHSALRYYGVMRTYELCDYKLDTMFPVYTLGRKLVW